MERIQELAEAIQYHSDCYYNGASEITDAEFDELWDELTSLDPTNDVLQAVGAKATGAKLKHKTQMGSLAKVTYDDDGEASQLVKWASKDTGTHSPSRHTIGLTPKIDGLAVRLNYRDGVLVEAATRGDGLEGQNVLANIMEIDDIPKHTTSDFSGEVRGEVYMKKSIFKQLRASGLSFANPRNAASGSLMQKDAKKTGERKLSFFAYDLLFDDDCRIKVAFTSVSERFWALERLEGITPVKSLVVGVDALPGVLYDWEHVQREELDYDIDGLVFEYVSTEAQEEAGWNGRRPRGKMAWKFKAEEKVATIEGVDWQVGRTGKLTPVARISPTQLGGTCVQNVTLHNYKMVKDMNIALGDKVLVEKAGDIIPHIIKVHEKVNTGWIGGPTACPACGGEVKEDGVSLVCQNIDCHAKLEARVDHYLKRIGVLGIGGSTIKGLVACGALNGLADLYYMNTDDVRAVTGSQIVTRNMLEEIFGKCELPLATFLSALGIHALGRTTSKALAKEMRTLDNVRNASYVRLCALDGIGDTTATAIIDGLDAMSDTIDKLVEVLEIQDVEDVSGPLAGLSFCLTGTMSRKRTAIAADIELAGGEVRSSVGRGLSYLVQADPSSMSSKSKKALANGTEVIGEDTLRELMSA